MNPLSPAELAAVERAAAIGFHREPPAAAGGFHREAPAAADPLAVLAFAAQQRRLDPLPPRSVAGVHRFEPPADPRPILPPDARANLRRLVTNARRAKVESLLVPVAWALRARGARLHPFDTDLLRPLQAAAGPYEWWLAEQVGLDLGEQSPIAADDTTWTALPPAQRAAWLRRRRHEDPDAARALLQATWNLDKAEVRLRLLATMEVRLGPADVEFLQSLAKDRSGLARDLAGRLATRAGGDVADDKFTARILADLPVSRVAFVGPKRVKLPGGVDKERLFATIARRPLTPTLGVLQVDLDTVLASDDVVDVMPAFALGALLEGRLDWHEALLRRAVELGWRPAEGPWRGRMLTVPRDVRRAALAPLLRRAFIPAIARALDEPAGWLELLDGPLPVVGSQALRATPEWRALVAAPADSADDAKHHRALAAVAAFVPGADARAAVADLDKAGAHTAPLVRLAWILLADLEPSEGTP